MDNERKVKFLYPPFLLIGALSAGLYFENKQLFDTIFNKLKFDETKDIILIVLGGGVLILVLGYVIGTITIFLLRILAITNRGVYEIKFKQDIYGDIAKLILKDKTGEIEKKEKLYAVATYDHQFLNENIHNWLQRRWNSFYISANSTTSLILAIAIGLCLCINPFSIWGFITGILLGIFLFHSIRSRNETLAMIEFQLKVNQENKKQSPTKDK